MNGRRRRREKVPITKTIKKRKMLVMTAFA